MNVHGDMQSRLFGTGLAIPRQGEDLYYADQRVSDHFAQTVDMVNRYDHNAVPLEEATAVIVIGLARG